MAAQVIDRQPSSSDSGLDHEPKVPLQRLAILAAVGLAAILGVSALLEFNHAQAVEISLKDAQVIAETISYEQALSLRLATDDGIDTSEFISLVLPSVDEPRSSSIGVITEARDTIVFGYRVATFGRQSCVVVAVNPRGSAVFTTGSECLAGFPEDLQDFIDG